MGYDQFVVFEWYRASVHGSRVGAVAMSSMRKHTVFSRTAGGRRSLGRVESFPAAGREYSFTTRDGSALGKRSLSVPGRTSKRWSRLCASLSRTSLRGHIVMQEPLGSDTSLLIGSSSHCS